MASAQTGGTSPAFRPWLPPKPGGASPCLSAVASAQPAVLRLPVAWLPPSSAVLRLPVAWLPLRPAVLRLPFGRGFRS
ncbi:hypothetical protein NM477_2272 [Neisseria meningitidis NM477]|nr:hypothetical protein NM477_2272 [Neisseria meningitidis NM477]